MSSMMSLQNVTTRVNFDNTVMLTRTLDGSGGGNVLGEMEVFTWCDEHHSWGLKHRFVAFGLTACEVEFYLLDLNAYGTRCFECYVQSGAQARAMFLHIVTRDDREMFHEHADDEPDYLQV